MRRAVLAAVLVHAVLGLDVLVQTAWNVVCSASPRRRDLVGRLAGGVWFTVFYGVNVVWIVIFVALVLGITARRSRGAGVSTAGRIAASQLTGSMRLFACAIKFSCFTACCSRLRWLTLLRP